MGARVTSLQVAMRAGVSQSAVSRVFTPGAPVSARMAEKVRRAAEDLGYRPNNLARSLTTGRTRIIGVVVAYLDNQFYPEALERLSNALQACGYHVLVFMSSQGSGTRGGAGIDDVLQEILDYQVDGIVMASVSLSSKLASRCQRAGVPVVLFNRSQDLCGIASVTADNVAGGAAVARFLLAGGHAKPAYIAGWAGASTQRDREAGFTAVLAAADVSLFARGQGEFHAETAKQAAREMFDRPAAKRPDAVFVANDHMAFGVMDVLRAELRLEVPGDVSVVGFDDTPPAAWAAYDLTTMRQRAKRMVEETVALLMARIGVPEAPAKQVRLEAPLVVRGSARIPTEWSG